MIRPDQDPERRWTADDIVWHDAADIDQTTMARSRQFTDWLLAQPESYIVRVTDTDAADNFPCVVYIPRKAIVEYLPGQTRYIVGRFEMPLPRNPEVLAADIDAVSELWNATGYNIATMTLDEVIAAAGDTTAWRYIDVRLGQATTPDPEPVD